MERITMDHELAGAALAAALDELLTAYPTDPPDAPRITVGIAAPTGPTHYIPATPGQIAWLTLLLMDEGATNRNAHADGSGACAHCKGSGAAGPPRTGFVPQA